MWQPVNQSGNISQRIVSQVEELLSNEQLRPGDRLPSEREMAQLLGASRPSLREAVRVLQAQGRLVVKHGQGVFVAEPKSAQALRSALGSAEISINELFAMREVLEVPAAGWAAEHIAPEHIGQLTEVLDELDAAFDDDPEDFERLARLDAGFHLLIADIAENRFLHQTSHVLHEMLMSGMQTTLLIPGRREKSKVQHLRIIDALRDRDAAGARRAARVHIRSAHRAALDRIAAERTNPDGPSAVA
ncbi:MAG: FCD domain-containing protein [Streptosporangiales bacterium]|nr:FCD domain-containing protein [Streptosporangiales bacterium]